MNFTILFEQKAFSVVNIQLLEKLNNWILVIMSELRETSCGKVEAPYIPNTSTWNIIFI